MSQETLLQLCRDVINCSGFSTKEKIELIKKYLETFEAALFS